MTAVATYPNPLKWTGGYYAREAIWPSEPDVSMIKSLALQYIVSELPAPPDPERLDVSFFAKGGFNKLCSVSYPGHLTQYLFRVALPLVPKYKVESEAATLTYVKAISRIPVARVVAWDSSARNALGFEWILLQKLEGVALCNLWRTVPFVSKVEIVKTLACLLCQLQDTKFDYVGGLYFKDKRPQDAEFGLEAVGAATSDLHLSKEPGTMLLSKEPRMRSHCSLTKDFAISRGRAPKLLDFTVGELLSPLFYMSRRLYLPGNRGPFRNSYEWMTAELDFQMQWIKTGAQIKSSATRDDFDDYDWDSDYEEESPEMGKLCSEYIDAAFKIFLAAEEKSSNVLYYHDLSLANIIVNPVTLEITGIIDWELVQVVPEWKASRFPKFLTDQMDFEEIDDGEPRMPTPAEYDEDGEEYHAVVVERRDRWDIEILRQHYDDAWNCAGGSSRISDRAANSAATKRAFEAMIMDITDDAHAARKWLERSTSQT